MSLAERLPGGNLLAALPATEAGEAFEHLFEAPGLRIERIVSRRHASPPDFWYDQPQDEWVMVVSGKAVLEFSDGSQRPLRAGDWVTLQAHVRHRIATTSAETVWLTVHYCADRGSPRL